MLTSPQSWSYTDTGNKHEENFEPASLYQRFFNAIDNTDVQREAISLLDENIQQLDLQACDLPVDPSDLEAWMQDGFQSTTAKYADYRPSASALAG